jgi:flagellar export protein FliJ
MQASMAFIQSLSRQIQQQEDLLEGIKQQEDDKRGELVEKTQMRQMVEKLDQKRKDEAVKESDRKTQRMMDVLAQRLRAGY